MARALILLAFALALAGVALPAPARADGPVDAQTIETYLARAQKLFDEQEYASVVQTLGPVTRDARATRAQRLRALELIALAQFIRNDRGAARATFERILDLPDPILAACLMRHEAAPEAELEVLLARLREI